MTRPKYGVTGLALLVAVSASVAAGCAQERSAEAYCRAFYETATPIRDGYVEAGENVEGDPVTALVRLISVPGDLAVIFDSMVDHAPDEIRSDTEAARDHFRRQQEALGDAVRDPLSALASGLVSGAGVAGSLERVDAYLSSNCPPPPR